MGIKKSRTDIDAKKEWITEQLKTGTPRLELCRALNCRYKTLLARIREWGLDQYKNQQRKGRPHMEARSPAKEYLKKNSPIQSSKLKAKLIEEGYFKDECSICKITDWMDKPILIVIDHINGNSYDNRLKNIRLLCPNCHSQTDTYKGRNKHKLMDRSV